MPFVRNLENLLKGVVNDLKRVTEMDIYVMKS